MSGLHFAINQTPWSSYITIRKKLVDPSVPLSVKPNDAEAQENSALRDENKRLRVKVNSLQITLVDTEE